MTTLLHQVTLDAVSNFREDSVVNTFVTHKEGAATDVQIASAQTAVMAFYNTTPAGEARPVAGFLAAQLSRAADSSTIKSYDITDLDVATPSGSPVRTTTFALAAAGAADNEAAQLAAVLTLRGRDALISAIEAPGGPPKIRPRQRHSGRLFLGPFNTLGASHGSAAANDYARPDGSMTNVVLKAAEEFQDTLNAVGWTWCVWSRRNEAIYAITSVSMDNSWDLLKTRKRVATARTARVFAPVPDLALGA